MAVVDQAPNLERFALGGQKGSSSSNLSFAIQGRLEKVEELKIDTFLINSVFSVPSTVLHLTISWCSVHELSTRVFFNLLTSGNLRQLKTLNIDVFNVQTESVHTWSGCMKGLNLPMIENIRLKDCEDLSENDVIQIVEAAPLFQFIPKLKSLTFTSRRHPVEEDLIVNPQLMKQFCTTSLAAKLEVLRLKNFTFTDDAFKELMENAAKMQRLQHLRVPVFSEGTYEQIAQSGARGGWPMLKKLALFISDRPIMFPRPLKVLKTSSLSIAKSYFIRYGQSWR